MKIFPDFEMKLIPSIDDETFVDGFDVHIQTQVRKNFSGKWYKIPIRSRYWVRASHISELQSTIIKDFYTTCYRVIILWKYNPDKLFPDNIDCEMIKFELDIDQRSEEDRLNNKISKLKFV